MWCVILQPKGTTRNAVIPVEATVAGAGIPEVAVIGQILRRAAPPERIGTWKWNGMTIVLYAYKTGKAGTENKHELPPPHDKGLYFGEAVLIAVKGGTPVSFQTADFTKFYAEKFGGFEETGDGEEEEEEDEDEDEDEEEEEEEEEVEEAEGEEGEEAEEEVDPEAEAEAEKEVKKPVKVAKVKRNTKKMPTWYTQLDMEPEPYTLTR